jgi:hypothetical protein
MPQCFFASALLEEMKKKGGYLTAGSSSRANLCPKLKERLLSFFLSHTVTLNPPHLFIRTTRIVTINAIDDTDSFKDSLRSPFFPSWPHVSQKKEKEKYPKK